LIETYYNKNLVFSDPLLACRNIGETNIHSKNSKIPQVYPQFKFYKRAKFLSVSRLYECFISLRPFFIILLLSFSFKVNSKDLYITTSDLNIRSGPAKFYKSLGIIKKGDTVIVLETTNAIWVKISYDGNVGYSSSLYLEKIYITNESSSPENNYTLITIFLVIGLFICIIILIRSVKSHRNKSIVYIEKYKPRSNKSKITTKPSDNLIIDITGESHKINIDIDNPKLIKYKGGVPYWKKQYIYYYTEINGATREQIKFYNLFRDNFFKGKYYDLEGNDNYAFILYFDLLNEYNKHRDLKKLERQFQVLSECYPKTEKYTISSLIQQMNVIGDIEGITRLRDQQRLKYQSSLSNNIKYDYVDTDYYPDDYKLGHKYKDKLGLNKQETAWLNKFWNPSNVFISMEGCCVATIMQYIQVLKGLNIILKDNNTSIAKEVEFFKERIIEIKGMTDSYWDYYDKRYLKSHVESDIYLTIFKRVENSVREVFGHKRKVGEFPYYEYNDEFEKRIGLKVNKIVSELKNNIGVPDISTQIELNAQNVNRWREEFTALKESFEKENINIFIDGITLLEEANQKNPNIENIFYEASKFIAKYNKVQALKYYSKYIHYDLISKKIDNKQLSKTIQKSLFNSDEQINEFKRIIEELIKSNNIEIAIDNISKLYIPKRKKIFLDKSKIQDVEQKYKGTVELLNEYLKSEEEKEAASQIENLEKDEIEIFFNTNEESKSIFVSELNITNLQEQLIQRIAENAFVIHQDEVERFALQNGMLKNQLIDSINEICFELLDGEALIEEDEENYIIEESYYNEILNK